MLEYIYFVKCPGCEDEHFSFFNEAKDFAMNLLSQKPIITQIEVDRNDFGECVDSCDLGTVWSWEEAMGRETEDEPAISIFTKDDLVQCDCDGNCSNTCKCGHTHEDPEFAALDNSLEVVPKKVKKPVPADMSIEDLVEAMEANEDTVECAGCEELFPKEDCFHKEGIGWLCSDCEDSVVRCTWCEELFDKSECRKEVNLGWLCDRCRAGIMSRGEPLTFRENTYWDFLDESADKPMDEELDWHTYKITYTTPTNPDKEQTITFRTWQFDVEYAWRMSRGNIPHSTIKRIELIEELQESANPNEKVEFTYDGLAVTLHGNKRAADDWDEVEDSVRYSFFKTKTDVANDIWENFIQEEDAKDIEGGLETLEDDKAWADFLIGRFDDLLDKYYDKLLKYYEDDARKEYEETHSLNESVDPHDLVELVYPSLTATLYGEKRAEDDWDEVEHTDSHVYLVPKLDVATVIWENWITEEDAEDVLGGLKTLEDDRLWNLYLEKHFDDLFEKYNKQILDYYKEEATEDFRERSQEESQLNAWAATQEHAYDDLHDDFNERTQKPFLEEFDDAETHKANLIDCPECGSVSYDMKEQYCINCGLGL